MHYSRTSLVLSLWLLLTLAVQAQPPQGERYALLIGAKNYAPTQLRNLKYPEKDVLKLAEALRQGGYRPDRVRVLTQTTGANNPDFLPIAKNVRQQLQLFLQDRRPGDSVLVAFAGHGLQFAGSDENYFCPMDANRDDRSTLIPLSEVYKQLETCKADLKLLLVDACRDDPLAANTRSTAKVESVTRPQKQSVPGGVVALFGCSASERAFEDDALGHGVFFHFVIKGLTGAARSNTGDVTVLQLQDYVQREVADFVAGKYGARQMPELVGRVRGSVPLVHLPKGEAVTKSPASVPGIAVSRSLQQHTGIVRALAFSPGGTHLVAASQDKTMSLSDAATGRRFWQVSVNVDVFGVAMDSSSKLVAFLGREGTIGVLDAADGKFLYNLPSMGRDGAGIAFHPSKAELATMDGDGVIRVWNLATRAERWSFRLGDTHGFARQLLYSPDGKYVLAIQMFKQPDKAPQGACLFLDAEAGKDVGYSPIAPYSRVAIRPDGQTMLRVVNDDVIAEDPIPKGEQRRVLQASGTAATFLHYDYQIVLGTRTGELRIYDAKSLKEVARCDGRSGVLPSVAVSSRFIAAGESTGAIKVWERR